MSLGGDNKVEKAPETKELELIAAQQSREYDRRGFGQTLERYIAQTMDSAPEMKQARGLSTAETARAFGAAMPKAETAALRRGGTAASLSGLAIDQGVSGGLNLTDTTQSVRDERLAGLGDLVAVGRGDRVESIGGLSRTADTAQRQAAIDAEQALANRQGLQNAASTGLGLAAYGYMNRGPKTDPLSLDYGGPINAQSGRRTVYGGGA